MNKYRDLYLEQNEQIDHQPSQNAGKTFRQI